MAVASFDLCKELYELSGWIYDQHGFWWHDDSQQPHLCNVNHWPEDPLGKELFPPYDLGYLLRKLPEGIELTNRNGWMAKYSEFLPSRNQVIHADTPEDAACKLAVELFKQDILKKAAA
jgi:hypothetical protein